MVPWSSPSKLVLYITARQAWPEPPCRGRPPYYPSASCGALRVPRDLAEFCIGLKPSEAAFREGVPEKSIFHAAGILVLANYDDLFSCFIQIDPCMRIGNAGIFVFLVSLSRSADFPEFLTGNENLLGSTPSHCR